MQNCQVTYFYITQFAVFNKELPIAKHLCQFDEIKKQNVGLTWTQKSKVVNF